MLTIKLKDGAVVRRPEELPEGFTAAEGCLISESSLFGSCAQDLMRMNINIILSKHVHKEEMRDIVYSEDIPGHYLTQLQASSEQGGVLCTLRDAYEDKDQRRYIQRIIIAAENINGVTEVYEQLRQGQIRNANNNLEVTLYRPFRQ